MTATFVDMLLVGMALAGAVAVVVGDPSVGVVLWLVTVVPLMALEVKRQVGR